MLYRPIKNQDDFKSLIHIGETPEGIHWDYKQQFNDEKKNDVAIDLAAFANTLGGSLLIGVSEKNIDGRKVANNLFNIADFERIKKSVYTSILDLISPHIDVQVVPIKIDDALIVAINVEPSVNLVSVSQEKNGPYYCFPYRTDFGNRFMAFDEVEKRMMDNKSRAIYLKLKKHIPSKGKVTIYPFPIGNYRAEWFAEWNSGFENEITLWRNDCRRIIVPLTYIDEVWKGNVGVCIKMNTRLYCTPDFIDFENSEKVAIYEAAVRDAVGTRNFFNSVHNKK
ncbi:MAG: ATP-binding protein [Fibrobacter sp.]|nr:ATP-binding protein [Fibrobacter sp.]